MEHDQIWPSSETPRPMNPSSLLGVLCRDSPDVLALCGLLVASAPPLSDPASLTHAYRHQKGLSHVN